jgi:hypothetical protein
LLSILPLAASLALAQPAAAAPSQAPELISTAPKAALPVQKAIIRGFTPPPAEPKFKQVELSAPDPIRTPARFAASSRIAAPSAEAIDIPAREEWTSTEGFRFSGSKLAFKRRF